MRSRLLLFVALGLALYTAAAGAQENNDEILAYHARGILQKHCQSCHSGGEPKAGFEILDRDGLLKEGIVANNAQGFSELVQRVKEGSMPPGDKDKLSD